MDSTITTTVKRFFSSHNVIDLTTIIMNITVRDAMNEPGLYKETGMADDITDLVKFILQLDSLSRTQMDNEMETAIRVWKDAFYFMMAQPTSKTDESHIEAVKVFTAYLSGIEALFEALKNNEKPVDYTGIINQVNNKLK